uniref:HMG box domain-containing protein n=1 Tax=Labrus bergylta TaxID=56723 RepID=A0A3Q3GHQ1_9LABR
MKWADVVSYLDETIAGLLADPAHPPPPPPDVPAGFEPNAHPQEEKSQDIESEEHLLFETGLDLSDMLSPTGSPWLQFGSLYMEDTQQLEDLHGQEGDHIQEQVRNSKKPPNAFMLYMKEQRPNVPAEILERGSAEVNVFLGQTWRSLSKGEQARYYLQADMESCLHSQMHPEWTTRDNYGKKTKRMRRRRAQNVAPKEGTKRPF